MKEINKKVSIIVPVYNVEKYLNICVKSIVNQTYKNIEIILIDDGSKDNCGSICDEWAKKDCRIHVVHKENEGLGFARNTGLDYASGEYVMYVDSDDYIDLYMVEKLLKEAINRKADTVFCGLTRVQPNKELLQIPSYYDDKLFVGEEIIDSVLLEMIGSNPTEKEDANLFMSVWHALYSMDIIKENNIRFPSERKIMCEDIMYHIDYLTHANRVVYIKDCLYFYRVNPISLSQVYDGTRFERQKALSKAICTSLNQYISQERYIIREQRRLLGGARGQILAIVASEEKNKLMLIKNICEDEEIKNILEKYPYKLNPIKHRIFNFGLKYRITILIYILAFMTNKCRG